MMLVYLSNLVSLCIFLLAFIHRDVQARSSQDTVESGLLTGPEFKMKAAIYDGLFKPQVVVDYVPQCDTGNCTFPLFDSLAVCSKCLDISQNVTHINSPSNLTGLDGVQNVSYGLPAGAQVDFSVLFQEQQLAMGPGIVITSVLPPGYTKQVLDLQDPLLSGNSPISGCETSHSGW